MENTYTTPLAKWSRILEIFIPGYMFGKAWGIATEKTVDLYRAAFPAFLIDGAESLKDVLHTTNANIERLVATSAGALIGFAVIFALGAIMFMVLRDRKYIDAVRFTSVTMIPIAVMNGTLSHLTNTLLETLGMGESVDTLTKSALEGPRGQVIMFCVFYFTCLWMMGKRTGVKGWRRYGVLGVGLLFVGAYFMCGLMITADEWQILLPKLQATLASH